MYKTRITQILYPIYILLHFIYRVYLWFTLGKELFRFVISFLFAERPTFNKVKKDVRSLKKIPRHIGIVFSDRDVDNLKKIAQLICWSLVIGVHFITIFDAKGILKLNSNKLLSAIHDENKNFFGKDYINYDLKFQKSSVREPHFYDPQFKINSKVINLNNHTHALNDTNYPSSIHDKRQNIAINRDSKQENDFNNHTHSKKNKGRKNDTHKDSDNNEIQSNLDKRIDTTNSYVNHVDDKNPYLKYVETEMDQSYQPAESEYFVRLVSWQDGRAAIVNLTRCLAQATYEKKATNNAASCDFPLKPSAVQQYLCTNDGILWPCVDLVLKFDHPLLMSGFPPWSLRYAEFFFMGQFRCLTYKKFLETLDAYAKREQRYGK
jgi:hypothetical protein